MIGRAARSVWILCRRTLSVIREMIAQKRWELALLDRRVTILPGCKATSLDRISFGSDVLISHRAFMQGAGGIRFGSRVMIGPNVMFITTTHDKVTRESRSAPITIGDGVWIGAGAVILPGVVIGEGSIVGAGAVVTREVPAHTVAVGCPAKQIGTAPGRTADQTYFSSRNWLNQFGTR